MKTVIRSPRLFWGFGLGLFVTTILGTGHLLTLSPAAPAGTADAKPPVSTAGGVMCFGHVDVESGVASLTPVVPGRVAGITVHEGQAVLAGAVLIHLDDRLAQLHVQEAQADLVAAQQQYAQALKLPEQQQLRLEQQRAAVKAAQQRVQTAGHVRARKQELQADRLLNFHEADAASSVVAELEAGEQAERVKLREAALDDPSMSIQRAQAGVEAKQARLGQAQRETDECFLRAPANGLVLRIMVHTGDVLDGQSRHPAVLFCPEERRIVRTEVPQEFACRVQTGQSAAIEDDTMTGPRWRGTVTRISDWYAQRRSILQEPLQFNDVRTLECLIALDADQPPLRIGQRVRVHIGGVVP